MTAEVEAKDELIKSQAATIRQLQSDNDAKERELKDLRGRLFACPTTEQIKAQTKKHILGAMVYPNNVQLQKVVRKRKTSKQPSGYNCSSLPALLRRVFALLRRVFD